MDVLVTIDGREAIPVRAIPLLTDWQVLWPDAIAKVLAGEEFYAGLKGLGAYRLNPDCTFAQIPPRWWANWVVRNLQATSDEIKTKQTTHEEGYQQWRCKALAQLPTGVFLWRDEFEVAYAQEYGPDSMRAWVNRGTYDPSAHVLNFNPHPDPEVASISLILEGFEAYSVADRQALRTPDRVASEPAAPQPVPTPPAADGITTAQVAVAFDGILFSSENWPKRLSEAKWTKEAMVAAGAAGGSSSLWNPLKLARLLYARSREDKPKNLATLNTRFKRQDVLAPWRNDWNEFYTTFNDADGFSNSRN